MNSKFYRAVKVVKALELSDTDVFGLVRLGMEVSNRIQRRKLSTLVTTGSVLYSLGKRVWHAYCDTEDSTDYTLTVSESEERLYAFIMRLVYEQADRTNRQEVEAALLNREEYLSDSDSDTEVWDPFSRNNSAGRELMLLASPDPRQVLHFAGVSFTVSRQYSESGGIVLTQPDGREFTVGASSKGMAPTGFIKVTFRSEQDRATFVAEMKTHFNTEEPYRPRVFVQNSWGEYTVLRDAPYRSQESVILQAGQKERIMDHIRRFVINEKSYSELGIPWHAGLLFYGPPGTGKSSLGAMIATALDYDTYVISLSSVKDDNTLVNLMTSVRPRSIILLEDIDRVKSARQVESDHGGVTQQGLLNVLDGATSCHGTIVIMTTNNVEHIQPELLRPGRVDLREEIGYLTNEQMINLCDHFLGGVPENLPFISEDDRITSAELVGVFRDHIEDLPSAMPAVRTFIEGRKLQFKEIELNAEVSDSI